ncbi:MAG: hypothetical protein AAF960_04365 [Bacteroidota bacterium]
MNRKKKRASVKGESTSVKNNVTASAEPTSPSNNFLSHLLTPAEFEKTALIVLNIFFGTHLIGGFLLLLFFSNKFTSLFHKNRSIDGFQMTAIGVLLAVFAALMGGYYCKKDKIDLLKYSHLTLLSAAFGPYIFLKNVLMKENPVLFFLVLTVCGYVFYKALSKVNFDFVKRWKWANGRVGVITLLVTILVFSFFSVLLPSLEKHWLYLTQAYDLAFYANQLYHMLHEGSSFSSIFGKRHFSTI